MRSLYTLIAFTVLAVSAQAHAWGFDDHRTYHGPISEGPQTAPGPRGPIVNAPRGPIFTAPGPVYHPAPVYRPGPIFRAEPIYRPAPPIYHSPVFVHPYPVYHSEPTVYWRTGHWAHTWHENRFGWWWVNGLGWSFYSSPVYPYPDPVENQTTIIYQSAPVAEATPAPIEPPYPPPVSTTVATASGNTSPPSNTGMYYFCESSQLYYPYAKTCSERWKAVPTAP